MTDFEFTWEHRMVRGSMAGCGEGEEPTIYLAEVSFNKEGKPYGYNDPFMCSESIAGLYDLMSQLLAALDKPILDYDTDFVPTPSEFDITDWRHPDNCGFDGPTGAE